MSIKPPLLLLAAIAAFPPLAVDMYLPAMPGIAEDLGVPISLVQNSLSVFLLGFGLGLLSFGPLSDRYGRRPLALLGVTGFALSSFLISRSESGTVFLLLRLLQGFIGAAATVTVPGMIRDCYGRNTAKGMSSVSMIMLLAPLVAPLAGSFLLRYGPWRLIFDALTLYAVLLLPLLWWRLPETRPAPEPGQRPGFLRNYRIILANRGIYLDLACFMLSSLAFFTFLTSVSFLYITWYGVSETQFGLLFAGTVASLIAANALNIRYVGHLGPRRMLRRGLLGALAAASLLLAGFLAALPVWWTAACLALLVGSLGIVWINADALVLIAFPQQASSASAVTGTLRFGSGALAGPLLSLLYTGTPLPIAAMILATLLVAGLLQYIVRIQEKREDAAAHAQRDKTLEGEDTPLFEE